MLKSREVEFLWQQIERRCRARAHGLFRVESRPGGFVQHDGKRLERHELVCRRDLHVVERVARLCAEVCADFTVDGDATRRDQLITMPARSDASGREKRLRRMALR